MNSYYEVTNKHNKLNKFIPHNKFTIVELMIIYEFYYKHPDYSIERGYIFHDKQNTSN